MKNLIYAMLLSLTMLIAIPASANQSTGEETQTEQVEKKGLFGKVKDWAANTGWVLGIGIVVGIFGKDGMLLVKKVAHRGSSISKEIGEALLETSDFLNVVDNAIKDDGKLKENSAKEFLQAGKPVITEWKDVIVTIKPKKV